MTLRNHTMRDLLSKLDAIVSETALKDKNDLDAKRQALDDLESDPIAGKDPEISAAIDQRRSDLEREAKAKGFTECFQIGDAFGISFSEDHEIATEIVDILEDGIVIELDDTALDMLANEGLVFLDGEIVREEKIKGSHGKACWKGYRRVGKDDCVKVGESGLQYYTGKKKYGKDGMAALAKAGREGASEEELGRIKDKFKKEDSTNMSIGQMMARDGITYSPEKEKELIGLMGQYMQKAGMSPKAIRYYLSYDEDYVSDQLEHLPRKGVSEGRMSDVDIDLQSLANRGDEEDLIAALDGDLGPGTADVLQNMMDELKDELASKGMNDVINDQDKMIEMLWDKIVDEYGSGDDSDEGGETDDSYALASAGFGSDEDYESIENEAKYQGKEVPLGKKLPGDVKKSKVYVRKPNGKVVKVNFGDKKMRIKKSNPARRKSFRARHNCKNPGPRWKARYWSCRSW